MSDRPAQAPTPRHAVALRMTPDELLEALRRAGYAFPDGAALEGVFERRERGEVHLVVRAASYAEVGPGAEAPAYPARQVLAGDHVIAKAAAERAGGAYVIVRGGADPTDPPRATSPTPDELRPPAPLPGEGIDRWSMRRPGPPPEAPLRVPLPDVGRPGLPTVGELLSQPELVAAREAAQAQLDEAARQVAAGLPESIRTGLAGSIG